MSRHARGRIVARYKSIAFLVVDFDRAIKRANETDEADEELHETANELKRLVREVREFADDRLELKPKDLKIIAFLLYHLACLCGTTTEQINAMRAEHTRLDKAIEVVAAYPLEYHELNSQRVWANPRKAQSTIAELNELRREHYELNERIKHTLFLRHNKPTAILEVYKAIAVCFEKRSPLTPYYDALDNDEDKLIPKPAKHAQKLLEHYGFKLPNISRKEQNRREVINQEWLLKTLNGELFSFWAWLGLRV